MDKFEDKNIDIYSFTNEIIVVCPECSKKAYIFVVNNIPKMTCKNCGYNKKLVKNNEIRVGDSFDPFFNYELFLKINCCNNLLFAYNLAHLQYIKNYVSSKIRERNKSENHKIKNRSMISRLPQWIKDNKNRNEILKKISVLEEKFKNET